MSIDGLVFGRYEVGTRLGKGGFGVVHVARDTELGREVAIKFLRPEYITRTQVVQRFLQEAHACAKIGHPGIVTVFECGLVEGTGTRVDGTAYIVMERLRGESLGDRLETRGRLPAIGAIGIARQLAAALHVAHHAGIIHRDLKPDNVFLVRDAAVVGGERVKVLDFGVAKLTDPDPDENPNTHSQMMLGTPRYMSPEQARAAAKVDHRTDIYALGCLLYELVCGKPPFGGDIGDVLVAHQTSPITPPRELVPAIPAQLDELIVRMLAKDPGARPQSMREVDDALDAVFGSLAPKKRAKTSPDEEKTIDYVSSPTDEPTFRLRPSRDDEDNTMRRAQQQQLETPVHLKATLVDHARPAEAPLLWWRWRFAIGIGTALLSALVVYLVLRKPARDERVIAVPPDAARVVEPDPAIVVAAPPVDATPAGSLGTMCTTAQFDKNWVELEACGRKLAESQPTEGNEFVRRAVAEARSEIRLRAVVAAIKADDLATATIVLAEIPDTSVYRNPSQTAFTTAKGPIVDQLVAELNTTPDCARHATRLRAIATRHGPRIGDEVRLTSRPCVRAPTLAEAMPTCDRTDEEESRGDSLMNNGLFAAALLAFDKVVRCRPAAINKAYLAACRARSFVKAKRYFAMIARPNIAQICMKEGFDPR